MIKAKQAIILVAGEGRRLRPFTQYKPKCFAEVAGQPILKRALYALSGHGCEEITVVTGHLSQMVREIITDRFDGMAVRYVENPDYATSNSMLSLALGLEGVNRPTWVLEGDVIFDPAILALSAKAPISWFADSSTHHLDGAYIGRGPDNLAVSLDIVRDLSALRAGQLKSMGILHLSQEGVKNLQQWLAQGICDGRQNDYYDLILRDHLGSNLVQVVDVAGHRWFEIDSNEDLDCASSLFS